MVAFVGSSLTAAESIEVESPNGQARIRMDVKDFEGDRACPIYDIQYRGKPVVVPSRMGFDLSNGQLTSDFAIVRVDRTSSDTTWKPVYGERSSIRDRYSQAVVTLRQQHAPKVMLQLTLRAYDEGTAFFYTFPPQPGMKDVSIVREKTEFRLPSDGTAWATYTAQGIYTPVPVSSVKSGCERPLVVRLADDLYAAFAEARLVDYARTKFGPLPGHAHSLVAELGSAVKSPLPLRTPWRVVMLADSPGQLLENNFIILNLNDPCALADTSWIKPGKVIREVTLSTAGSKACIDFCVKHHLQYVELDCGWYGPEKTSDPHRVAVKADRPQGDLDMIEVVRYGKERGVGIVLYINQTPLEKYVDDVLPLYRSWGVQGVKYGFVSVGSQRWTTWLHAAIRKAGENRLMLDIHDEYRPTGYSRTYPNLLTQEGIRGDEEKQPNELHLMTLFTRMLAGPADITVCYYDRRVDDQASHAYQLAKPVCFYSPWQFLYWYDRPGHIGTMKSQGNNILGDEPELEFFDHLPTVWDETKILVGSIGECAVVARRSGAEWFIGGMNADKPRAFDIPLAFLNSGTKYTASIYSDDPSVPTRTHVRIEKKPVNAGTVLHVTLPARGGQAFRIVPE